MTMTPPQNSKHAPEPTPEQMEQIKRHRREAEARKIAATKKPGIGYFMPYIAGTVLIAGVATWYFLQDDINPRGEKLITAELTLDNRCGLVETAFLITLEPSGPTAVFHGGRATIQASSYSYVVIKANPKYKSFGIETPRLRVQPKMVVPVVCDEGRAAGVLGNFNEQFKK